MPKLSFFKVSWELGESQVLHWQVPVQDANGLKLCMLFSCMQIMISFIFIIIDTFLIKVWSFMVWNFNHRKVYWHKFSSIILELKYGIRQSWAIFNSLFITIVISSFNLSLHWMFTGLELWFCHENHHD